MSDYMASLIKLKLSTSDKSMKDLVDEIHDGFTQPQVRDGVWHLIDRGEVFIGRDRLLTLQNPYPVDTERDSLCQQLAVMRAALAECATVTTRVSAQLRHAYHNLIDGRVYAAGVRSFADGLIAPQIRALEDLARVADVDRRRASRGGAGAQAMTKWQVFIPSSNRDRMGPELTEKITGHLTRLEKRVDELETALNEVYPLVKRSFTYKDSNGRYTSDDVFPSAQSRIKAALREHIEHVLGGGKITGCLCQLCKP